MWDGAFSPTLRKSIGTVRFVPLLNMTARDWAWLDYNNIRLVAQERIASMAVQGKLAGFFQVLIVQKAQSKHEYFWPGSDSMVDDFAASDEVTVADDGTMSVVPANGTKAGSPVDFFGNEPDINTLGNPVQEIDSIIGRTNALGTGAAFLVLVAVIAKAIDDKEDNAELVDAFNIFMAQYLSNENELYVIAATFIALRFLTLAQVNLMHDELATLSEAELQGPEAVQEQATQIWDYLNTHRQQIAAGRGLT
jgi:hypothetical protein